MTSGHARFLGSRQEADLIAKLFGTSALQIVPGKSCAPRSAVYCTVLSSCDYRLREVDSKRSDGTLRHII